MNCLHPGDTSLPLTAIILAGGQSSRMGQDKGLMSLQGKALTGHILEQVRTVTGNILIITSNPLYKVFGYPCYRDLFPGKGPLGGIYTGLMYSNTQKNLVLACDTPFISRATLQSLLARCGSEDAIITEHGGKPEPLCAIYDKNCIPLLKKHLQEGKLKILDALNVLKVSVANFDKSGWLGTNEFANINTREELEKYEPQTK